MIKLYSLFHLNTSFSSVEKKDQKKLINKCYWPLLNLIEKNNFKIAIELSGKTLEDIHSIDRSWVLKFKNLLEKKKCELIGSGYSQIIGPLVPEKISIKNLEIGNNIYKKLLKKKPILGLVNEQVFSSSMIKIYKKFFNAIIIDWITAKVNLSEKLIQNNSDPCFVKDDFNNKIRVIWSNSISFQKFQRVVFGEIEFKNFLSYVNNSQKNNLNCIYSNDAEIFNYRVRRFGTENKILCNEWNKVEEIYKYFYSNKNYEFVNFSFLTKKKIKKTYKVTNAKNPVVVKKQSKYNINRWAVCGKDNLLLNTYCWRIFNYLEKNQKKQNLWKELCEMWGSDYRTHTTKKKWLYCKKKLERLIKKNKIKLKLSKVNFKKINNLKEEKEILKNENFITFKNNNFLVSFNLKKGLALHKFIDKKVSKKSLVGTILQGDIKNYGSSSDFFSGNSSILKKKSLTRFTDLSSCKHKLYITSNKQYLLCATFKDNNSDIILKKDIYIDLKNRMIKIQINLNNIPDSIVRLFKMTINPNEFREKELVLSTNNGGDNLESFKINEDINHGASIENVSNFTSSRSSFGLTKGQIIIGDKKKSLIFETDKNLSSLVGMLEYTKLRSKYFLRLFFSAYESDDTSSFLKEKNFLSNITIRAKKLKTY